MKDSSLLLFAYQWFKQQELVPMATHHINMLRWLESNLDNNINYNRLLLMAFRGAGKSTIVGCFCAWLLSNNPNIRILIISAELYLAKKLVQNVANIINEHDFCKHLIAKNLRLSDQFVVKRTKKWRDPSVLARGINGNITGSRSEWIICDDVEVPNTCGSYSKRKNLREKLSECEYILTPQGNMLYIGTPHNKNSIYADETVNLSEEAQPFLANFKRFFMPVLDNHNKSVWSQRFTQDRIKNIKANTGKLKFNTQMLLQFIDSVQGQFDYNLLGIYNSEYKYYNHHHITLDNIKIKQVICFWDPAFSRFDNSDKSAVSIVFKTVENNYFIHRVFYLKNDSNNQIPPSTYQCEQVIDIIKQFNLSSIYVEDNGIGKFLPQILQDMLRTKHVACSVASFCSKGKKNDRIVQAFETLLNSKKLFIHNTVYNSFFMEELKNFDMRENNNQDDGIDSVASAILLIEKGMQSKLEPTTQYNNRQIQKMKFDIPVFA